MQSQEIRVEDLFLSGHIQGRQILFSTYCRTSKILLTRSKSLFQVLIFMLKYGMKDVVYLVFLWCFFGFVHSIMISHFFKEIIGSFFEEKRMLRVFGTKYKRYKENVPRFLPYKFTHSPGHKDINV